ncbi:MAG: ribosome maturation factor RimM [Rikenellaceae bacterium]
MESVARINRLFGVDGEVMISLYSSFPEGLETTGEPLFVKVDGLYVPFYLEKFERRGRAGAVVAFADIDTERRVSEFLNYELFLPEMDEDRAEVYADDEFTLEDLVGYTVEASSGDGEMLFDGEITGFIDGRNPLFEVMFGDREVLIPAAEEFIAGIDFDEGHIIFALPAGLLEL